MQLFLSAFALPLLAGLAIWLCGKGWGRWKRLGATAGIAIIALAISLAATHFANLSGTERDWVIAGRVEDETTGKGLPGARVSIEGIASPYITETDGNFRVELNGMMRKLERVRVTVSKPGYKSVDGTVTPPQDSYIVLLPRL